IVCDMTRHQTFEGLDEWLKVFRNVCPSAPVIFLGNKADLREMWRINPDEMAERAARDGTAWYLTSAKTGENVELAFTTLGTTILTKMEGADG
ncbi:MAG: GTP-binding protein, partial [Candidatus Thermoplasmatota archaeon]